MEESNINTNENSEDFIAQSQDTDSRSWLKNLERQSWEAELLISGFSILGTLQLPNQIGKLSNYLMINSTESYAHTYNYLFIYLYYAVFALIIIFITHFVMRTIWIGLLGLNSVFPDGIQVKKVSIYSARYIRKVKDELGELDDFNVKLDNLCSVMFAVATNFAMVFIAISLNIVIFLFIIYLLTFIPIFEDQEIPLILFFAVIYFLPSILMSVLAKPLQKYHKLEDLFYTGLSLYSKSILLIFFLPTTFITTIFQTNLNGKKHLAGAILMGFVILIPSAISMKNNVGLDYLDPREYFTFNAIESSVFPYNYENLIPEDAPIFTPIIQSDLIEDEYLKLFIPILERENKVMKNLYGEYSKDEELSKLVNKNGKLEFALDRFAKFHEISIDGNIVKNIEFLEYIHPHNSGKGMGTIVSIKHLESGKHLLKIVKQYQNAEGDFKTVLIPFFIP